MSFDKIIHFTHAGFHFLKLHPGCITRYNGRTRKQNINQHMIPASMKPSSMFLHNTFQASFEKYIKRPFSFVIRQIRNEDWEEEKNSQFFLPVIHPHDDIKLRILAYSCDQPTQFHQTGHTNVNLFGKVKILMQFF